MDTLLALHGQIFVIDDKTGHWVKFVVQRVPVSAARPHGLDYSLTLHERSGKRMMGFDNAHTVKGGGDVRDHTHRQTQMMPYHYTDAGTLLEDFWTEVDRLLRHKGA